jgi:hypothetical protein
MKENSSKKREQTGSERLGSKRKRWLKTIWIISDFVGRKLWCNLNLTVKLKPKSMVNQTTTLAVKWMTEFINFSRKKENDNSNNFKKNYWINGKKKSLSDELKKKKKKWK